MLFEDSEYTRVDFDGCESDLAEPEPVSGWQLLRLINGEECTLNATETAFQTVQGINFKERISNFFLIYEPDGLTRTRCRNRYKPIVY